MRYIALIVLVLVLAACGGSSSPTASAAALLSKTGATTSASAYTVTPEATNAPQVVCSVGAAEADGMIGQTEVSVCMFTSNAERQGFLSAGQYSADAGLVQVGQAALIVVTGQGNLTGQPPVGLVQSVASKTGGSVTSTP